MKAATAVTQWGGTVRIISTHNGDDSKFNELVTDIRAGRQPQYALHRVTLDDAIAQGLARRVFSVTGQPWYEGAAEDWRAQIIGGYTSRDDADEELFCIPRQGGGAYFPRLLIESCMTEAPVVRFTGSDDFNACPEPGRRAELDDWLKDHLAPLLDALDPARRHAFGMDFARSGDLSVIAPLELGATLNRRCPFLLELQNVPHLQQVQALTCLGDRLPRLSGGAIDAGGNGSFIAEAAVDHYGSIIDPVKFTEAWYREHMPRYKAAFEDGTMAIPKHDDVLEDHRAIQLVRGVPKLPPGKTDRKGERHGDAAIALALAYTAAHQTRGPIEYQSAGLWGLGGGECAGGVCR